MSERAVRRRGYDAKRRASQDWRHLYKSKRWAAIKRAQRKAQPYCQECARLDPPKLFTPMSIVDHVDRHGGDPDRFFRGPFQSLCKSCHDSRKQSEERRGFKLDMGADGWPVDDRHPGNRAADGTIGGASPQTFTPQGVAGLPETRRGGGGSKVGGIRPGTGVGTRLQRKPGLG